VSRRRWTILGALAALVTLASCGYHLVGRASNIPADVKKVHLKTFENTTQRVGVEQILTRAVADELVTRQRFEIVSDPAQADAELAGTVQGFSLVPVTFDADGRASEYEIVITAKILFHRLTPETVLWSNDRYQFRDSYPVESSSAGFVDRETATIEQAAKKFAETVVTDLLEGF
jgi:outer membrane lipopolysaccharide assembly protein LptE/RlpB